MLVSVVIATDMCFNAGCVGLAVLGDPLAARTSHRSSKDQRRILRES
jgi:hypothetical protein